MSKERYEQWGYESFKDNKTGEICDNYIDLLNQQDQRIAELEEQLKNAVVLKPDRYVIVNNWWKKKKYGIAKVYQQVLDSYSIQTGYMGDVSPCLEYGEFATLEEAQAKLEELKGEQNGNK